MKKTLVALTLAAMTLPALAQDKKAPEPDYTITGNLGIVSDYRFRGASQTDKKPAVQGGFDFAHKSGFYLGTWASNVSSWASLDGSGQEIDIYGGFKGELPLGINFDAGYISYKYPSTESNPKQNTAELYFGISKGPFSYKASRTMSDAWFGIGKVGALGADAKGSLYHDLTLTYTVDKITLIAHAGYQDLDARDGSGVIATTVNPSFKDYKIGVNYDMGDGFTLGLAWVDMSFKVAAAQNWFINTNGADRPTLYKSGGVISLTKTF